MRLEGEISDEGYDKLLNAEKDFRDYLRTKNYFGRPEISARAQLVSNGNFPQGSTWQRFESYLENLELMVCLREGSLEDISRMRSGTNYFALREKADKFGLAAQDRSEAYHDFISDGEMDTDYTFVDIDLEGVNTVRSNAHRIVNRMENDGRYIPTGYSLETTVKAEDVSEISDNLNDELSLQVLFRYDGDEAAVKRHSELIGEESNTVPGRVEVGSTDEFDVSMDKVDMPVDREVEEWVSSFY